MINKVKAFIGRFNKSKDGKVLASNFGYLMLLQIAGYIFPLITIPYLARVIGVEGFGKIAFAAAIVVWLQTVSDWGFNYTATRDVARNRDDMEVVSRIFSNVFWARILLMVVSFVILFFFTETIPYFKENQAILLVTFLLVPGHIMFPAWFFQAMERMKYITIFNLISKALFTALVFVLIKEKQDYILQPLLMSLGYLVCGIGAMYIILAKWNIKLYMPHWPSIKQTISGSTDVFLNNISRNLYNSFSVVLLGFFSGSTANGLLDAGRKFVNISQGFMSVFERVFFPLLSRKFDFHKHYAKGMLFLSFLGTVVLFLSAPLIIDVFYTDEFSNAVPVLQLMSVSLMSTTLNSIYGINHLVLIGKARLMRNITLSVSIIGFLLAFPMVYYFSYLGAAVNIVLAQTLLGLIIMAASKRNSLT